ncbi:MAG: hypothetical protein ACK4UU_00470 [Fimbriimonadales bacterium]
MKRAFTLFLKDILEAMEKIEQFIGETPFEAFVQDDLLTSAIVRETTPARHIGVQTGLGILCKVR